MQLLIFCSECEVRGAEVGNLHGLCTECIEDIEALALLRSDMDAVRAKSRPYDTSLSYEAELMAVPGSRTARALEGFFITRGEE